MTTQDDKWGDVSLDLPSAARLHVLALVSGFPELERNSRLLLMFQAYIDESGHREHSPVMVLAGYAAPTTAWLSLSDDWLRI